MRVETTIDDGPKKEDSHIVSSRTFGVFDGAGGLDKYVDTQGRSSGLIASSIAQKEFTRADAPLTTLAQSANQEICKAMLGAGIDITRKTSLWCTTAAVIRLNKDAFEWLQIGDSLIIVIYDDDTFELLIKDYDHDEPIMKIWRRLADEKKEGIRKLIDPQLRALRSQVNETYGCLTGEEKAMQFLKTGTHSLSGVKHILLFTDGIFIPKEDPSKPDDWEFFVKMFLASGFVGIKNLVRAAEEKDPHCWKYPRYKQYDDISAIALTF